MQSFLRTMFQPVGFMMASVMLAWVLPASNARAQEAPAKKTTSCAAEAGSLCLAERPVAVSFPATAGEPIILTIGSERLAIDPARRAVRKLDPEASGEQALVAPVADPAPTEPRPTALPAAQERPDNRGIVRQAVAFDFYLVNLPTTRPVARGSLHLRFTHRFLQPAFLGTARDLFGLDSFSISSFGFTYGVTNRIAAIAYRSPYFKTIELGGLIRLLDEGVHQSPISASARMSVERMDNFSGHTTVNLAFPISRTITRRAEFFLMPTISLRANPFPGPFSPEENLFGLGLGATVKVRPSVALTGEYVARLDGFKPFPRDTISWGVQKRTLRHVFEFVFSNSFGTTTSHMLQGGDFFKIGFNIQRQLH